MYKLGKTSAKRLEGVHPLLVACVVLAMRKYSSVDFGVAANAVRTMHQQKRFVEQGKSKTMNSKHLPQEDGYSWAVDLYPVGYGDMDEESRIKAFHEISESMARASYDLGLKLEQGIYWDWQDSPHHEIKRIL